MRRFNLLFVFILFVNILGAKSIQNIDSPVKQSLFDLVNYQDIQEVYLEFDLTKLLSDRRSKESFKASFQFEDRKGTLQSWKTKVELRGKFRRSRCSEMPPLKLNFKKGDLAEAGLTLHDDFKLVTQCMSDDKKAKEVLMKEYLAYKIYNELTTYSFRVQFLKINFKDTSTGETKQQWGFMIEDTAEMRTRLGAEKYDKKFGIEKDRVAKNSAKVVALFQYMIGNLDWDLYRKSHNVKVIEKNGKLIPVPYDFDFSGLVSAPYALLNPNYEVRSIRDRYYLGDPEDLKTMRQIVRLFESKEDEMIKVIKDFKPLSRGARNEMIVYLNTFYETIDNIKLPESISNTNLSSK